MKCNICGDDVAPGQLIGGLCEKCREFAGDEDEKQRVKTWKAADKEQYDNSPLYREMRRQTNLLQSIKNMLLALVIVVVVIPVCYYILREIMAASH